MARKSRKNQPFGMASEPESEFVVYSTAVYIRLSVEDNKKRGNSVETQKYIIENHIALHPDFKLCSTYIDNGLTGTNFDRPAFGRMMEDIENGKINCIIVKDLSRLGRNVIDTGYYLEKYFPMKKVRFVAINDNYDSAFPTNDSVMLPLKNMINEAYSLDIAKKIRSQAKQSMKAGDYVGARPPYGYSKAPDNCHQLIVDKESATVVCQIFEWACDEIGVNDIAMRLNEGGVMPPSQYAQSRGLITHKNLIGGGQWQTRTVSKILSSEVYTGDLVQGKTKSIDHKQRPVNEENWIVVHDTHEAIISHEMFNKVKAYRQQVAEKSKRAPKRPYSENVLRGKIFCGCCHKNLHRQRTRDVYLFHCISNTRIAKGFCKGVYIPEAELFEIVMEIIKKKAEVIIGKQLSIKKNMPDLTDKNTIIAAEISSLCCVIERQRDVTLHLYESLSSKEITIEEYRFMKGNCEKKQEQAVSRIAELEQAQDKLEKQVSQLADLTTVMKAIRKNTKLTAALVDRLIERITITPECEIQIVFTFQDEFSLLEGVESHA